MSRPFPSRHSPPPPQFRINGKIRAREVRVLASDGSQVGVMELSAAINRARSEGCDLVEVSASAVPPVCRIVDFGKFKYENAKRERDSKKSQHVNIVKEVQLTPRIDPHDLGIKREHAVGFLCEDMKVKIALRFRGREMAHTEIGMGVVQTFLKDLAPWGHPDFPPKLTGRSIGAMVSPLPRSKRARNPKEPEKSPVTSKPKVTTTGSGEITASPEIEEPVAPAVEPTAPLAPAPAAVEPPAVP
ncbi:MAG: hypothetical protein RIS76_414 [Verrucomicrobiota bacterium]